MLQFLQTVSDDVTDTQDDVQSVRSGYWLSGMMDVNPYPADQFFQPFL